MGRPKTLLDVLPLEIRQHIWALALIKDAPIDSSDAILAAERHNGSKWSAKRAGKKLPPPPNDAVNSTYPRLQPALLATCRQIRREAYLIYYGENTFTVEKPTQITHFVEKLHPQAKYVMRSIRVNMATVPSLQRAEHLFESLAHFNWLKPFCALPVEVHGEGTVYMTEAETHGFEEVVSHKMVHRWFGSCPESTFEVRRKA